MRLRFAKLAGFIACLGSSPALADPAFDGLQYQYFLEAVYDGKSDYDAFTALHAALFGVGMRSNTGMRNASTEEYAVMAYANLISLHSDAVQRDPDACTIPGDTKLEFTVNDRVVMDVYLPREHFETAEPIMLHIGPHPIHSIRPDIRAFFDRAGCSSAEFVRLRERLSEFIREKS